MNKFKQLGIDIFLVALMIYGFSRDLLIWIWDNIIEAFFHGVIVGVSIIITLFSMPLWSPLMLIMIHVGCLQIESNIDKIPENKEK